MIPRCPSCGGAGVFGYRDKETGELTWYCAEHRLGQWYADARRDLPPRQETPTLFAHGDPITPRDPFVHPCSVCGAAWAPFGYGVNLRAGQLGTWYCGSCAPKARASAPRHTTTSPNKDPAASQQPGQHQHRSQQRIRQCRQIPELNLRQAPQSSSSNTPLPRTIHSTAMRSCPATTTPTTTFFGRTSLNSPTAVANGGGFTSTSQQQEKTDGYD